MRPMLCFKKFVVFGSGGWVQKSEVDVKIGKLERRPLDSVA